MANPEVICSGISKTLPMPTGARIIESPEKEYSGVVYGRRAGDCRACITDISEGWQDECQTSLSLN